MPTPITGFRLDDRVLDALDALAGQGGETRSDVVRRLILDEHARQGLAAEAADRFVADLEQRYGATTRIRFELDAAFTLTAAIGGTPAPDDLYTFAYFDANSAVVVLGDLDSTVRIKVGNIPRAAAGAAIEIPIGSLRGAELGWEAP